VIKNAIENCIAGDAPGDQLEVGLLLKVHFFRFRQPEGFRRLRFVLD
jgi:hypothetical protein